MLQRKFAGLVRRRLAEAGLLPHLPRQGSGVAPDGSPSQSTPVTEDSFIDDVAIPPTALTG
eukprot:9903531-Alexandrium_andersonii.AAC.1